MNTSKISYGSALIIVICILTTISMLGIIVLRNSLYGVDLSMKEYEYLQKFYATDGLMRTAIAYTQENYDLLMQEKRDLIIHYEDFISYSNKKRYKGKILIKPNKNLLLYAIVEDEVGSDMTIECSVVRNHKNKQSYFAVENWNVHASIVSKDIN